MIEVASGTGVVRLSSVVYKKNRKAKPIEVKTLLARFDANADPKLLFRLLKKIWISSSGCWIKNESPYQYHTIKVGDKHVRSHRLMYELAYGIKVPYNRVICHHCDRPGCINPEHLFIGTNADNIQDAEKKGKLDFLKDRPKEPLTFFGHNIFRDDLK